MTRVMHFHRRSMPYNIFVKFCRVAEICRQRRAALARDEFAMDQACQTFTRGSLRTTRTGHRTSTRRDHPIPGPIRG